MQSATPKNKSFGLGSFPFARRYLGNRCFFLFLPLLRCFSSRRLPSITYGFSYGYLSSSQAGFPIRISPDRRLFAPPRSFSQLVTSFFASESLGIPRTPFLNFLVSSSIVKVFTIVPIVTIVTIVYTFDSSFSLICLVYPICQRSLRRRGGTSVSRGGSLPLQPRLTDRAG